jgi:threonine 3-dehydrogenase
VPRPSLEVGRDYRDASMAIVKPRFAGFCGSDRGIWFRRSFGDMIREIKVHPKVLFRL